jgi:two-component system, NtrC family, sensor kinase
VGGSAHILVVEDSETQALKLRYLLEAQGFSVQTAGSAEAALESLGRRRPDLVVADLHLPGMDGNELTRNLRLNAATRGIPVLMLTESQEPRSERQGLDSGADAYISKSADWDLIVLRLRALLRRRGQGAQGGGTEIEAGAAPPATSFRRARIVVVDWSPASCGELEAALAQEGYSVEPAQPSDAVVASARANPPDCLIINIAARRTDAIALCARLSGLRLLPPLAGAEPPTFAIVLVGADDSKKMLTDAFAAGADDVLSSGMDMEGLRIRVRSLVRRKLLQDEDRRLEAELRERDRAIDLARAEAAAANARAALVDALEKANSELAQANARLQDAQGKLIQSAKMASLGELVAGIAHEINNPLAFILAHQGTVERLVGRVLARVEDQSDEAGSSLAKAHERLGSMRVGLQRIQDLVLNLRKFSRMEGADFQKVDVPAAIDTVIALLAPKLSNRIQVTRSYEGARELVCSPALLNQVVMNIIGNAADAIGGEGSIRVSTRSGDESYEIEIADDGPGIPDELMDRIFEPFFTTKPVGSGTGLGLAIAYGIVEAHGGAISVGDAPGGGAVFTLTIPSRRPPTGTT